MAKLTPKQFAVVETAISEVEEGRGLDLTRATEKIYKVKNKKSAASISYKNMQRDEFRLALIDGLTRKGIIGEDSVIEQKLDEGLEAEIKGFPDYRTRLEYIKEINKISGVYAPEKKSSLRMSLNIDLSPEELEERIKQLNEELDE